jgi:hypothetical protein
MYWELNTLLHVSVFQNAIIRESDMNMLRCAQCREKQRSMWAVYCDRRRNGRDISQPLRRLSLYIAHILLCFSRHCAHLNMFISDSLTMAFWNAETCSSVLSTNTLNEWCICWSFTHCIIIIIIFSGSAAQRGLWSPRSTRFLDHTQRRTTFGRTLLDEWSAGLRDLYLTTHNTHNRQTSMLSVGFEPTFAGGERP